MLPAFIQDLSKYSDNDAKNILNQINKFEFIVSLYAYFDIIKILGDFNAFCQNASLDVFKFT